MKHKEKLKMLIIIDAFKDLMQDIKIGHESTIVDLSIADVIYDLNEIITNAYEYLESIEC